MKNTILVLTVLGFLTIVPVHVHAGAVQIIKGCTNKVINYGAKANDAHQGYQDAKAKTDQAADSAKYEGIWAAGTVAYGVGAAAAHGAGSLAGYAGIASAVSNLGLGGVTTAIAGTMGSSATGAAATTLVTAAAGGPVIMGAILVAGTAATGYGIYKGGQTAWNWYRN